MHGPELDHAVRPPALDGDAAAAPLREALAAAAAELRGTSSLLSGQAGERVRQEALRRLQQVAADLERAVHTSPPAAPGQGPAPVPSRAHLLVADDEPDARAVLTEALAEGHEVTTAGDGQEALDLARSQRPDLVLLDLSMPRLDGFQVLEQLREDPATADIPVILVTGRGDEAGKVQGLTLGAVDYLQKPFSGRELRARVERTLRLLRSQTALRELAQTDALTGLPNLRAFRARLDDEVKRARRYRTPLTCVMADLDELKPINDGLGHAAGDRAIAAAGAAIRGELRETDFCARTGGDEFVVLLPHTGADDGHVFAERIRARLSQTAIAADGRQVVLRASLGVACLSPDQGDQAAEALVRAADAALYEAKRAGRGRVAMGDPGATP